MCGFTGFYAPLLSINTSSFYKAHTLLKHRGPDDEGFVALVENSLKSYKGDNTINHFSELDHINQLSDSKLVLGQHRLAIIDLSHAGHQPYFDEKRNYSMVYNGELFNYIELRDELKSLGHQFIADNDVEVVLKAFIEWGCSAFSKFNGMWALAIYDLKNDKIILSRDRFGIKPLYYYIENSLLVFGSEMKFIKSFIGEDKFSVNKMKVKEYIFSSLLNNSKYTFWNEIVELQPAHYIEMDRNGLAEKKYWNFKPKIKERTSEQALAELKDLFYNSLRLRMRSDVEVGTLLSGGLDSNAIVGTLYKLGLLKENEFKSFSAVFQEEIYSEKKYIDLTLKRLPLKSYFVTPNPEMVEEDMDALLFHMEEPFRSLAVYSQHLLYKTVKERSNVIVLLNGQGADELFGGYNEHYRLLFIDLIKHFKWKKLFNELSLFIKHRNHSYSYILNYRFFIQLLKSILFSSNFNKATFQHLSYSALREYLKYDDRNAMAYSLEARVPFLDYRIVEFAYSLSTEHKIDCFTNKKIQRKMSRGVIPDEIIDRVDKQGFVSPQEVWQRNQLKPYFDKVFYDDKLMSKVEEYSGKNYRTYYKDYQERKHNDWAQIWRVYNLSKWFEYNKLVG